LFPFPLTLQSFPVGCYEKSRCYGSLLSTKKFQYGTGQPRSARRGFSLSVFLVYCVVVLLLKRRCDTCRRSHSLFTVLYATNYFYIIS